jgi:molecular chaperone GrpE (heat shock protein)
MISMEKSASSNPLEHTANLKAEFRKLSQHLREDIEKVHDPEARSLFEVSAEVIDGLEKAFVDYERKNETAWINSNPLKS